jgi:hypothetical protein
MTLIASHLLPPGDGSPAEFHPANESPTDVKKA